MQENTIGIKKPELIGIANQLVLNHEDFIHGMLVTDVEQKCNVLIFKGDFFLDSQGLPTPKTTAIFNMFKYLAHQLSDKYHLIDG